MTYNSSVRLALLVSAVVFLICIFGEVSSLIVMVDFKTMCEKNNITCTGDMELDPQNVHMHTMKRFNDSIVEFRNSTIPTLPGNLFEVFGAVSLLIARSCHIRGLCPANFPKGNSLTELDLSNNSIRILKNNVFSNAINLRYLLLQSNNISQIEEDSLKGLTKLQSLFLQDNSIQTIPKEFLRDTKQLRMLDLRDNLIQEINSELFDNVQQLEVLHLGNNRLRTLDNGFADLLFLYNLPSLKKLNLSGNRLHKIESSAFSNNLKLDALYLRDSGLSQLYGAMFENLFTLKTLDLSENMLQNFNADLISPLSILDALYLRETGLSKLDYHSLLKNHNLSRIDISRNKWDCNFLQSMILTLRSHNVIVMIGSYEELANKTEFMGVECVKNDTPGLDSMDKFLDDDDEKIDGFTIHNDGEQNASMMGDDGEEDQQDGHSEHTFMVLKISEFIRRYNKFSDESWSTRTIVYICAIAVNVLMAIVCFVVYLVRSRRRYSKLIEDNVSVII